MKLSIIIPTLNEEKLLPQLLTQLNEPLLRNEFELEVIVSDGGSSDKTLKIARDFNCVVLQSLSEDTKTIAAGRNIGANVATGEILIFINADVLLADPARFFHTIIIEFGKSSSPAMTCKVKSFPGEQVFLDWFFHAFYNLYFFLLNQIGIGIGRGECQIVKKELFDAVGGYDSTLAAGEDFDLFRRLRKYGKIIFYNNLVVYESPRRFQKLGYLRVAWLWTLNAFSILFKGKSLSKEWEQIR